MYFSKVRLRSGGRGSTGALAAFVAQNARAVGNGHHVIWSLFGDMGGERSFLYRMTGGGPSEPVLVYSRDAVVDTHNLWDVESKEFRLFEELKVGNRLAWQIKVNATRKVASGPGIPSKRHDLTGHARKMRTYGDLDVEQVAQRVVPPWLQGKLAQGGLECALEGISVQAHTKLSFHHEAGRYSKPVTLGVTDVVGTGTVTDPDLLRQALVKGIGHGKGYGCGMLLIRKVN